MKLVVGLVGLLSFITVFSFIPTIVAFIGYAYSNRWDVTIIAFIVTAVLQVIPFYRDEDGIIN